MKDMSSGIIILLSLYRLDMVPFLANDGLDLVCVFTQMGYGPSDMTKYM